MEIVKTVENDILVLALAGDFDTTEAGNFSAEVTAAVDDGYLRLLLDLTDLGFINSTGLGSLLRAQKRMAQYGGGVAVCGAGRTVKKTFQILQLHKRIPLFDTKAEALKHLEALAPETVSASGEEVEFFLPEATETFGERPRLGRLEEMYEEGLALSFENLDELDADVTFAKGTKIHLRFRLPLYHPTHVFEVEGAVLGHEMQGRETILVRVAFTSLEDPEKSAVQQYVKDLRLLQDDS